LRVVRPVAISISAIVIAPTIDFLAVIPTIIKDRRDRTNAVLKSRMISSMLKQSAAVSTVITLPPGLTIIIYSHKASEKGSIVYTNAVGIERTTIQVHRINCLDNLLNKRIRFQKGSIVSTIALRFRTLKHPTALRGLLESILLTRWLGSTGTSRAVRACALFQIRSFLNCAILCHL
jgi:hypothetical protein